MAGPLPTPAPRGPFAPSIGFYWGRSIPSRQPISHQAEVDCDAPSFTQRMQTRIDDDDSAVTYPAMLVVTASRTEATIELTVWKNGNEIYYSGTGVLVTHETSPSTPELGLHYSGDYGTFNQQVHAMDMPSKGNFDLDVGLDCARRQLATENLRLNL